MIRLKDLFKKMQLIGDFKELEETDVNKDSLTLNGTRCFYGKRFKLGFIIENIDKSRNKLIEKMNEAKLQGMDYKDV